MVLNDVTNEFSTLIDLLSRGDATYTFIRAALDISIDYQNGLNSLIEIFLKSPKKESNRISLANELVLLEKKFSNPIATMSASVRVTTKLNFFSHGYHSSHISVIISLYIRYFH